MKETIFELNETKRENKTFHFQPNQHYDAIKGAIFKRQQKRKCTVKEHRVHEHIGGLPSPPVEDKKEILSVPSSPVELLLSSNDIRQKIKALQDEKHALFQMLKSLMTQEQQKKKRQAEALAAEALKRKEQAQAQAQAQALALARKRKEEAEEEENRQQQLRKKSRWAPVVDNYYSNNNRYYPPRYHSPYNNTNNNSRPPPPPRSHHYSISSSSSSSRPPFPR